MDIGNKIKQLRLKSCLTQEQLASKLGISPQTVSKWETSVTMPDITLLPSLAGEFGITIDELFDLTVNQKLHRIENRLDIEEELSANTFDEYEEFLKAQIDEYEDKTKILSLLAHLYHHRMQADARKVSKYAREAILRNPEKKDCQWLLIKAEGANIWDWNISNHTAIIDFYKQVIESDVITPKTPLPYYEIMDNLIADHRTEEAERYLKIYQTLPAHKPFLVPVYKAHIALSEYNVKKQMRLCVTHYKCFLTTVVFYLKWRNITQKDVIIRKRLNIMSYLGAPRRTRNRDLPTHFMAFLLFMRYWVNMKKRRKLTTG